MNKQIGVYITKDWLTWSINNLTNNEIIIFNCLLIFLNYKNGQAWPNYGLLQQYSHLCRENIRLALRGLEKKKVITTYKVPCRGAYSKNSYALLVWNGNRILSPSQLTKAKIESIIEEEF